jgi:hypothetical protein
MTLSKPIKIALAFALLLLIARAAAPPLMVRYVNNLLQQQPGISGQVRDIDLALWRGGYVIKDIDINQHNASGTLPLFAAKRIDIRISWPALLQGDIVSSMAFEQPVIMALDRTEQEDITEDAVLNERTWIGLANNLTLFSIDELSLQNGRIEFSVIAKDLFGELILSQVNGHISNLHNNAASDLLSTIDIKGTVGDAAPVSIQGKFNPNASKPSFDINMQMAKLAAAETDSIIKIYAPFDVEAGAFELAAELASDNGQVTGYVKAGIYQLDVFSWKEDVIADVVHGKDNPLQLFVEGVSAILASILENRETKMIATRIPIKGDISSPDVSLLNALSGLLRNAFIRAYNMDVEDIIDYSSVSSKESTSESKQP